MRPRLVRSRNTIRVSVAVRVSLGFRDTVRVSLGFRDTVRVSLGFRDRVRL